MNNPKIEYGNQLIQDFLNWKLVHVQDDIDVSRDWGGYYEFQQYDENGEIIKTDIGGDSWSWEKGDTMPFNTDWNLLMSAIKRINSLECSLTELYEHVVDPIRSLLFFASIEDIFELVINYIEFYNENK